MKKHEIIETLRSYVHNTKACRSDFEKYDIAALEKSSEPFLWMVREYGTSLVFVGAKSINEWFKDENWRIRMFQCNTAPIGAFTYYIESGDVCKFFYYDGLTLKEITSQDVMTIYNNLTKDILKSKAAQYAEEAAVCKSALEIRFCSEETREKYQKSLEYAQTLNDSSLKDCVERLTKWRRCAVNHYVQISQDFTTHGYTFCEMINEHAGVCGGIIMNSRVEQNRWSIHT